MNCIDCSAIEPVEDEGELKIRPCTDTLAAVLRSAGYSVTETGQTGRVKYTSREELLGLLEWLTGWDHPEPEPLRLCITNKRGTQAPRWLTLSQLNIRFSNANLIDIIVQHDFCSYMQPIVNNKDEEIMGFEFLLRPVPQGTYFQPYELFNIARQTGFHTFLDRAARISAIESSARVLPHGIKRFINFLPSSIYNPKYCLTHTFEVIDRLNQKPEDFVFEVVETEQINDIAHLRSIFEEYRSRGMRVALDDVGAGYSTVEVLSSLKPDYVKIDRGLISFCDQDEKKQQAIMDIMKRSAEFGAQVLAEGIERREEFEYCRSAGVNLGQGYLFGKPEEKPPVRCGYDCL